MILDNLFGHVKNMTGEGLVILADCNLRSRGTRGPGRKNP
jgi:hypothetical protein